MSNLFVQSSLNDLLNTIETKTLNSLKVQDKDKNEGIETSTFIGQDGGNFSSTSEMIDQTINTAATSALTQNGGGVSMTSEAFMSKINDASNLVNMLTSDNQSKLDTTTENLENELRRLLSQRWC